MTVIDRQTIADKTGVEERRTTRRTEALIWAAAAIVIAALAVVVVVTVMDGGTTTDAADLRTEQQVLADLANRGYVPAGAVDWDLLRTESLVNRGLVPAAALQPTSPPSAPMFTADELALMHAARTGVIPMEAVDWDRVALRQLVNRGLIPAEALSR